MKPSTPPEILTKGAWLALAAIHVLPSAVVFVPSLVQPLYGVSPTAELGILISHRGALFLAIVAMATFAAFDRHARRIGSVVVAITIIGFLFVYVRASPSASRLATIALVDSVALIPLAIVSFQAWRVHRIPPE